MTTAIASETRPTWGDALVEITPLPGHTDAQLFAADLFRMYEGFARHQGLFVEVLLATAGDAGGYKRVIFRVSGPGAYESLQYEPGVHRVQRVPAGEHPGGMHTSVASVLVMPVPASGSVQEKIRTYNFPDDRATDHRVGLTLSGVRKVLDGEIEPFIEELRKGDS